MSASIFAPTYVGLSGINTPASSELAFIEAPAHAQAAGSSPVTRAAAACTVRYLRFALKVLDWRRDAILAYEQDHSRSFPTQFLKAAASLATVAATQARRQLPFHQRKSPKGSGLCCP
jgi:hypothetical protein